MEHVSRQKSYLFSDYLGTLEKDLTACWPVPVLVSQEQSVRQTLLMESVVCTEL